MVGFGQEKETNLLAKLIKWQRATTVFAINSKQRIF